MAKKKKRIVDVLSVNIKHKTEQGEEEIDFSYILKLLNKKVHRTQFKDFEFKIFKQGKNEDYIIGVIETGQHKEIPPKKNTLTSELSPINIDISKERLVFANIFLFDTKRNILIYEVNRDGCYVNDFQKSIYHFLEKENESTKLDIKFPAVIRNNSEKRLNDMNYFKEVTFEVYRPRELFRQKQEKETTLISMLKNHYKSAEENNIDCISLTEKVDKKGLNRMGLSRNRVKDWFDFFVNYFKDENRNNIKRAIIKGYTENPEGKNTLKPIDLLADTFNVHFTIDRINIHTNIQLTERKSGIKKVYFNILPEIKKMNDSK